MTLAGLTQAELMQLREDLTNELLMIKKFGFYAEEASDPQVRQLLNNVRETHERHRDILMRHLNAGTTM